MGWQGERVAEWGGRGSRDRQGWEGDRVVEWDGRGETGELGGGES